MKTQTRKREFAEVATSGDGAFVRLFQAWLGFKRKNHRGAARNFRSAHGSTPILAIVARICDQVIPHVAERHETLMDRRINQGSIPVISPHQSSASP